MNYTRTDLHEESPFWIVWCEGGGVPTVKHLTVGATVELDARNVLERREDGTVKLAVAGSPWLIRWVRESDLSGACK